MSERTRRSVGLYDGDRRLAARVVNGRYGEVWFLRDDEAKALGRRFVPWYPRGTGGSRVQSDLGLHQRDELIPVEGADQWGQDAELVPAPPPEDAPVWTCYHCRRRVRGFTGDYVCSSCKARMRALSEERRRHKAWEERKRDLNEEYGLGEHAYWTCVQRGRCGCLFCEQELLPDTRDGRSDYLFHPMTEHREHMRGRSARHEPEDPDDLKL